MSCSQLATLRSLPYLGLPHCTRNVPSELFVDVSFGGSNRSRYGSSSFEMLDGLYEGGVKVA